MQFVFHTDYGEILDVAIHLKNEGHKVLFYIQDKGYSKVGEGMIEKIDDWHECMGEGYIWVVYGCDHGKLQDWLRSKGEIVFGGCEEGDKLENDRQVGQDLFKKAGFPQPFSQNFKSIEKAQAFVSKNKSNQYILKQNGNAPKSINYMGKRDKSEDMIHHLEDLKKKWNEAEFGPVDFDIMEVVHGTEVAASALFNGHDWMRNKDGKVIGWLNYEEKKSDNEGLGMTCWEAGTTFLGVTEDNELFKKIILSPVIAAHLKKIDFRGVFDMNGCLHDDGTYTVFEATCRFGVPSSSYEFIEGMKSSTGKVIAAIAKGEDSPIEIYEEVGMVILMLGKPYTIEGKVDPENTSMGEKLWSMDDPIKNKHINLYNFHKNDEGDYIVTTESGYLLAVTARGGSVAIVREKCHKILESMQMADAKWRTDIGARVEKEIDKMV